MPVGKFMYMVELFNSCMYPFLKTVIMSGSGGFVDFLFDGFKMKHARFADTLSFVSWNTCFSSVYLAHIQGC